MTDTFSLREHDASLLLIGAIFSPRQRRQRASLRKSGAFILRVRASISPRHVSILATWLTTARPMRIAAQAFSPMTMPSHDAVQPFSRNTIITAFALP